MPSDRCRFCGLTRKDHGQRNVGRTLSLEELKADAHEFQPMPNPIDYVERDADGG